MSKPAESKPSTEWVVPPRKLNPLAGILSYLVPGLGQIVQGRVAKGLLFFFCIHSLFFWGLWIGHGKNVYLPRVDAPHRFSQSEVFRVRVPLLRPLIYRFPFVGQFWVGIAAWPAIFQWLTYADETSKDFQPGEPSAPHPLLGTFMRTPSESELNRLQTEGDKIWELGWTFTMIAGVLNLLVMYDAFAGPAFPTPIRKILEAPKEPILAPAGEPLGAEPNNAAAQEESTPKGDSSKRSNLKNCHLIFVSFDALQAAHVSALGYPQRTTPTLDLLAKKGYLFSNFHAVSSWTVPSSMTWFTGVHPSEHRMVNKFARYQASEKKSANLRELSPELMTLAAILRKEGYATGGFTGNAGVSAGFGFEQGFDVYQHQEGGFGSFDDSMPKALEWLKSVKDQKCFLFLHGYDVHGQCVPEKGLDYRFAENQRPGNYLGSEREQELLREIGLDKGVVDLKAEDVAFWRAVYDEKIQRADEKFLKFLSAYATLGRMDQTIFVLTADHGTEFFEHGRIDHGFTLYQEQVHVPLIILLPGGDIGTTISERLSSIDLMPTLLELAGVPATHDVMKQVRGRSLVPLMRGEDLLAKNKKITERDLICETDYREYTFKRCLITPDGWKWILTMETGLGELFDLNQDPGEKQNLAPLHPARAKDLNDRLHAYFRTIGHDLSKREWKPGLNPVYNSQAK